MNAVGLPLLLFSGIQSGVDELTFALLLATAPFCALQFTVTTTVTTACASLTSDPRLAVTVEPPAQLPILAVHDTNVTFAGRLSVTTTLFALSGPAFITVI